MKHKEKVVRQSTNGVAYLMKKNRVDVATGFGRIAGPGKVSVAGGGRRGNALRRQEHPRGDGLGAPLAPRHRDRPQDDPLLGLDPRGHRGAPSPCSSSARAPWESSSPRCSPGSGRKTTVIEILPRIVPVEDEEISRELAASFKRQGIAVYVDTRVERVTKGEGGVEVLARTSGGKTETFRAEKILMAVGRKPLSDGIGLEGARRRDRQGLHHRSTRIMRTNVPGIYAIGDVVPTPWLAHVASAEGVVAVEHMAGNEPRPLNYDQVPGCTYCAPEVASIGLTEARRASAATTSPSASFPSPPSARPGSSTRPAGS